MKNVSASRIVGGGNVSINFFAMFSSLGKYNDEFLTEPEKGEIGEHECGFVVIEDMLDFKQKTFYLLYMGTT